MKNRIWKGKFAEFVFIAIIIIIGFLLRIFFSRASGPLVSDECEYALLGKNLMEHFKYTGIGENINVTFPPVYPFLIGLCYLIAGNLESAVRIINLIGGTSIIFLVYLLGKKLYRRGIAMLAAVMVVFEPLLVRFSSCHLLAETTYAVFVVALALVIFNILNTKDWRWSALSGAVAGFVYLIRPDGIFYLVVLLGILTAFHIKHGAKKLVTHLSAVILAFVILVLPYVIFISVNLEEFSISGRQQAMRLFASRWSFVSPIVNVGKEHYFNLRGALIPGQTDIDTRECFF